MTTPHQQQTSKRRHSGPCLAQTPMRRRLFHYDSGSDIKAMQPSSGSVSSSSLKTPMAPRPRQTAMPLVNIVITNTGSNNTNADVSKLFLPSFDWVDTLLDMDVTRVVENQPVLLLPPPPLPALPVAAASRLKPRTVLRSLPVMSVTTSQERNQQVFINTSAANDPFSKTPNASTKTDSYPIGSPPLAPRKALKKSRSCHALSA